MQVENLDVYQRLLRLVFEVYDLTKQFPKFELYELGSQLRRAANSCAANLAEGFNNKHTNIYTESISRVQGEIREVKHHLRVAHHQRYITTEILNNLLAEYERCSTMLYRLEEALVIRKRK